MALATSLLLADSLVQGFLGSNLMGQALVVVQLLGSVVMVAAILGKWKELGFAGVATRRFLRDFSTGRDVLEYYLQRRPSATTGIEGIYKETCERLLKMLSPDARSLLVGRQGGDAALTAREVELVRGTCEHALDEEELRVEHGMGIISTVVALEPMLGLLGTVWGVLDAFAEMGTAGSANLATIAPAIDPRRHRAHPPQRLRARDHVRHGGLRGRADGPHRLRVPGEGRVRCRCAGEPARGAKGRRRTST